MQSSLKHVLTKKKMSADTISVKKPVESCSLEKAILKIKKVVYSFSKTLE